ncbi:MAG TPA: outer membrane beta-barrel protein [Candidatus Eisenbacteria bacterium]|jgi:opacity protein-like surface antigen
MKKRLALLSVALFVIALAPIARAQMGGPEGMGSNRLVSFGLGGGVSVPVSDAKDAFKTGFNGQGFARLNLKGLPISPRVDFTFSKFDVSSAKLAAPGATAGASGTGQILAGVANLQYFLMPGGPARPYIVAGVGAYNFKTDISGIPGATSKSDTRFGVNGGAGVLVKFGSMVSAFVEGRIDNVFSQKGFVNSDQIQVVPVTFGIVF